MTDWLYRGEPFSEAPDLEKYYGFVYLITNLQTGKMYVGKKLFWHKKTLPPLKGKTRKRRKLVESDWRTYYGSSGLLAEDVANRGVENFKREILHLCLTKGEATYYEAKEQLVRDVLLHPEMYYNDWVICKVSRKHLKL
jgi:hypothetical protein